MLAIKNRIIDFIEYGQNASKVDANILKKIFTDPSYSGGPGGTPQTNFTPKIASGASKWANLKSINPI